MKNLFTSKSIKFKSFKKFLAFIFTLLTAFPIHSFSQAPNPTLPGFNCNFNNPDGNLAYKCGTIITATINLPETPELASFTLTIPNSFQVINFNNCTQEPVIANAGAFINYASTTTNVIDGDLVEITYIPADGATTCTLNFAYRNCNLYPVQTNGAPANFDRMFFNCEGADAANTAIIRRPTINTNMINASTLAARVTNSTSPAIEITSSTPNPQIGYANTNYDRNFTVKLNSASIQNFDFFIANETDIAANSLSIVNGSTTYNSFSCVYNTPNNTFSVPDLVLLGLVATSGNSRTITFKQDFTLTCLLPSSSSSVVKARLACNCGSNEFFETPEFPHNVTLNNIVPSCNATTSFGNTASPNSNQFCPGEFFTYDVTLNWNQNSTSAILNSIVIPINTNFFNIVNIQVDDNSVGSVGPMVLDPTYFTITNNNTNNTPIEINVDAIYGQINPNWGGFETYGNNPSRAKVNPLARLTIRILLSANCQNTNLCPDPRISLTPPPTDNRIRLNYSNFCNQTLSPVIIPLSSINAPVMPNLDPIIGMVPPPAGASISAPIPFQVTLAIPPQSPFTINQIANGLTTTALSCSTTTYRLRIAVNNLPSGSIIQPNSITSLTINNQGATASIVNNEILIDLPSLLTTSIYNLEFNLSDFPCPDIEYDSADPFSPSTFGELTLIFTYQAVCSSCTAGGNECIRNLGCRNQSIFVHCPGPCTADIHTDSTVVVRRSTFGWASPNNYPINHIEDLVQFNSFLDNIENSQNITIDDMDRTIQLSRFYPYDILHINMKGERPVQTQLTGSYSRFQVLMSFNEITGFSQDFLSLINFSLKFTNSLNQSDVVTITSEPVFALSILQEVPGYPSDRWTRNLQWDYNAMGLDSTKVYIIEFSANFRITSIAPSTPAGNYPLDLQLQFALSNSTTTGYSCDPRNRQINILVPQVVLEEENSYNESIVFPNGATVFNPANEDLTESACKLNSALGITHRGGLGLLPDFNYEYRPLTAWPINVDDTGIDNVFGFSGTGDSYTLNSGNYTRNGFGNLINTHTRLQILNNQYKGLVLRLNKNCPNSENLTYPLIPINPYAYIHSDFNLVPPLPLPLQEIPFSLQQNNIVLDALELICDSVFQFGSNDDIGLSNGANNYDFDINIPSNMLGLPIAIKIEDNAGTNVEIGENLIIQGLNPSYQNGWFTLPTGFTQTENQATVQIALGGIDSCYSQPFDVSFKINIFCEVEQLNNFVSTIGFNISCMNCSIARTFQLSAPDLAQTNITNSFSTDTDSCELIWELEIQNPENQPDIVLTNLDLHFGSGLIFQHDPEATIICPSGLATNLSPTIDNFSLVVSSTNGGAYVENTISLNNINLNSGCTLKYKLRFKLSEFSCKMFVQQNHIFFASLDGQNRCGVSFDIPEIQINENYAPVLIQMQDSGCCQNPPVAITHNCNIDNSGAITINNNNPFSDTSPIAPMQAYLYTFADNLPIGSETNITTTPFSFTGLGVGTYTLITFNPYNGAFIIETIIIEDYTFTTSLTANPNPVCQGAPIALSATPDLIQSATGVPFVFEYDFFNASNSISGIQTSNEFIYNTVDQGLNNISVTVSNGSCSATANVEVSVVNCPCGCPIPGATTFEVTNFNDLINISGPSIGNKCIYVNGDLIINQDFTFNNCMVTVAPGRKIEIAEVITFTAFNSTFRGCDQMWVGIQNKGISKLVNCTIRDARIGFEMIRLSTSTPSTAIEFSTFTNNYIGLSNSWATGNHIFSGPTNCIFEGGELIQGYPGQNPEPVSLTGVQGGFAGMRLFNGFGATIDETNEFRNLYNGLIVTGGWANVFRAKFTNINYDGGNLLYPNNVFPFPLTFATLLEFFQTYGNHPNFPSAAINSISSRVQVVGRGTNEGDDPTFFGCTRGVAAIRGNTFISNSTFTGDDENPVFSGIEIMDNTDNNSFNIESNRIRTKFSGIRLLQNGDFTLGTTGGNVLNNNISILDNYDPSIPGIAIPGIFKVGIEASSIRMSQYITIAANTVNLRSESENHGIFINNSWGIIAKANLLRRYTASIGAGIYIEENIKGNISCNNSIGVNDNVTVSDGTNQAYNINSSVFHFSENYSNRTHTGIEINGPCNGIELLHNQMGDHFNEWGTTNSRGALFLGVNAVTGDQNNKFNSFTPGNWAYSISSFQNLFIVEQQYQTPQYYPPHDPSTGNCILDLFFRCDPSTNSLAPNYDPCGQSIDGSDINGFMIANPEGASTVANAIAAGTLNFPVYNNESKFAISKNIERGLRELSIFLPETGIYQAWKDSINNSNVFRFNSALLAWEKQDTSNANVQLTQQWKAASDSAFNYALAFNASISQAQELQNPTIQQGYTQLLTLQSLSDSLHNQLKLLNQAFNLTKRDTAAAYNQSINNPTDYENMEKTINEIYFSTVAIGEYYFSPQQKELITTIAFQCPLKSSAAVYKARSLYAIFNPHTSFNNHAICQSQGMQYRMANTNQSQSQLSIAQSGNLLQVNYSGNGHISQLKLINTLGQVLSQWQSSISENQKQENLDINSLNLAIGIYILQAISTDGKINNQKFSFNK